MLANSRLFTHLNDTEKHLHPLSFELCSRSAPTPEEKYTSLLESWTSYQFCLCLAEKLRLSAELSDTFHMAHLLYHCHYINTE